MGTNYFINDNQDVLIEILKRLDGRSLGVAACVCKIWCNITRNDSLWEHLCFRHVSPPPEGVRTVVLALGGHRRMYMVCVRPVLNRLRKWRPIGIMESYWIRHEVELSLSLFCVDYYERVLLRGSRPSRPSPPLTAYLLVFVARSEVKTVVRRKNRSRPYQVIRDWT